MSRQEQLLGVATWLLASRHGSGKGAEVGSIGFDLNRKEDHPTGFDFLNIEWGIEKELV